MSTIAIIDFDPQRRDAFRALNLEWLERHFRVEPADKVMLEKPEALIAEGGAIVYATLEGEVVGCCALKHHGGGVYELTKMAVTPRRRGLGIGRRLGEAVIDRYRELGGARLFLETHDGLRPAVRLYQSLGFANAETGVESPYARSNVFMVWGGATDA